MFLKAILCYVKLFIISKKQNIEPPYVWIYVIQFPNFIMSEKIGCIDVFKARICGGEIMNDLNFILLILIFLP